MAYAEAEDATGETGAKQPSIWPAEEIDAMTSCCLLRVGMLAVGSLAVGLMAGGCQSTNHRPPMGAADVDVTANDGPSFAVGVVPTVAPPVTVGTLLGFRLSSGMDGYGHLYVVSAVGDVTVLAENLPLAAREQTEYPRPGDGIQIRATPPAGVDRVILLATRQPFVGFADTGGQILTRPFALASTAEAFLNDLNRATGTLPAQSWAVAETRVEVVE